jgi:hypothetical protein
MSTFTMFDRSEVDAPVVYESEVASRVTIVAMHQPQEKLSFEVLGSLLLLH